MADYTLDVKIKADDQASSVFDKLKKSVQEFSTNVESAGSTLKDVGSTLSSTGSTLTNSVTKSIVNLGKKAVTVGADFDSTMSKVQALSGATDEDFETLRNTARELGSQTVFSATEAAEAMTYMAQAGWTTEEMVSGLSGIMDLAAASGEDLATTSSIVADSLTAFGLSASDSAHFSDVLAMAANATNTDVSAMGESFKYCAPVAGALGYSVEDVSVALGLMANQGIKASSAGTSLRTLFTNMADPTDEMAAAMETLGVSLDDGQGNMYSFSEVMQQLREGFGNLKISEEDLVNGLADLEAQYEAGEITESEFDTATASLMESAYGAEGALKAAAAASLSGKVGMSGLLALVNSSDEDFNSLSEAIANCDGTCSEMAATMQDNLSGDWEQLSGALEELAISASDLLVPALRDIVTGLTSVVDWFNGLDEGTQKTILTLAGVAAAAGPVLLVVGKLTSGIGSLVSGVGSAASKLGSLGSAASSAASPMASSATSVGSLAQNALGLVAAGAGILLAATGLALLAQSAIAISESGPGAAVAMVALVAALAVLAVGAAAIAAPLTAGAVGLAAFGAAIALVGVGVLAACAGLTLLATQLPTIAEYGGSAAVAILELSVALVAFAAGAIAGGAGAAVLAAGAVALAAGLVAVGVGATAAAVGVAAMAVGVAALAVTVLALAAGVVVLATGLTICGAGLTQIGSTAGTAAEGFVKLASACAEAFVPITSGAVSVAALDAAMVILTATLALSTAGAAALDVAMLALAAEMVTIAASAESAATDLETMVTAVDVVETGLNSLQSTAEAAIGALVSVITAAKPSASGEAEALATAVTAAIKTGLLPISTETSTIMTQMKQSLTTGFTQMNTATTTAFTQICNSASTKLAQMNTTLSSQMSKAQSTVQSSISKIEALFKSAKLDFSHTIALPHFSMSGSFDAKTGTTPTVNVNWYRSAYDTAMTFSAPTVMGTSGFGDGNGSEVVVGDEHLIELFKEALAGSGGDIVIPVYIGQERIDEMVVTAQKRSDYRSGGR